MPYCSHCGDTDSANFPPSRPTQCRACNLEANRRWRANSNKDKETARNRALLKNYGINLEQYEELRHQQNGCCAVCGIHETENLGHGKAAQKEWIYLAVDHNHETGEVRGLLCWWCNLAAGYLRDSSVRAQQMANYLARTRSVVLEG